MGFEKDIMDKLNGMEKAIHNNSLRTERIDRTLKGDPEYNQKGIIQQQQEHINETKILHAELVGKYQGLNEIVIKLQEKNKPPYMKFFKFIAGLFIGK